MTGPQPPLFGRTRESAMQRIGTLAQVARVDRFVELDGPSRGGRRFRVVTGGGLEVDIHPDRALDLGQVTFRGVPIAWMSAVGMMPGSHARSTGTEWLRSFGGGLLTTCGLDTFGPPTTDDGVDYPMHGRVGTHPATVECVRVDERHLVVEGTVRQARVFGENLVLRRRWSAEIGGTRLLLRDQVTNEGTTPSGHMILYHVNLGWPLLDEGAQLDIPSTRSWPRDADAQAGVDRLGRVEPPQAGFREQVFGHDFSGRPSGHVRLDNPALGIAFTLEFDAGVLPGLHQWKMSAEQEYVLGLEPTNVNTFAGRAGARAQGVLPLLDPGATVTYSLAFDFSSPAGADRTKPGDVSPS